MAPGSGKGQDASAGIIFDLDMFSSTLSSNLFFLYADVVLQLHLVGEDLGALLESCPCHGPARLTSAAANQRSLLLKMDYGHGAQQPRSCVLSGMRAPELAMGLLQTHLSKLTNMRRDLLSKLASATQASVNEWAQAMQDYDIGCQFMQGGLALKLSFGIDYHSS